jgi:hypothetical protein
MAREGRLDLARIHVLNPQQGPDFPLRLSTSLLPEWPFASRRGVPDQLTKAVSLALLKLPADSPAALAGKYYGFAPPGDYTPIEAILLRLKTDPGRLERFDAQDVAEKYWWEIHLLLSPAAAAGRQRRLALAAQQPVDRHSGAGARSVAGQPGRRRVRLQS